MAPDSDFEPARLAHLVTGNEGRLLDLRRTPVRVVEIREDSGMFVVELLAFEDVGALWESPFEAILGRYQLALGSATASPNDVERFEATIARLDEPLSIPVEPEARQATEQRIAEVRLAVAAWLDRHARFDPADLDLTRTTGHDLLYGDLAGWMRSRDLLEIETAFATRFVRNPNSGELVKGHRIVLAELGLCPFEGRAVRDPTLFDGAWSHERRQDHIVARMAFVRELLTRAGHDELVLFRGMATEGVVRPAHNLSFLSSTPSREVAESFCKGGRTAILIRHTVPVRRVFMTYLETLEMNRMYKEVEVVLLFEPGSRAF